MRRRILVLAGILWSLGGVAAGDEGVVPRGLPGVVLRVGPDQFYRTFAEAEKASFPGATILIAPGDYAECVKWRQPGLGIRGLTAADGKGVRVIGKVCDGKAQFIISGSGVTVDNIAFEGAHAADDNGAGIRAQGGDLTVRGCRFIGNQNGILTAAKLSGRLLVEDTTFIGNGFVGKSIAHAIYAGRLDELVVRRSVFRETRQGHSIKSRAGRTIVEDTVIEDLAAGTSSYLIDIAHGGDIVVRNNRLQKGRRSENRSVAIAIGFEGVRYPNTSIVIEGNELRNDLPQMVNFVENRTPAPALLRHNRLVGAVRPLQGPGRVE